MFCQNILLVDDQESLLRVLEGLLTSDSYKIHLATNAHDALKIIENIPIAVTIADQRMPGMTGANFLDRVRRISPETIRVILSGFEDLNLTMDVLYQGRIFMYLKKPWEEDSLKSSVKKCVMQYVQNQCQIVREDFFKEWKPDLDKASGFLLTEADNIDFHYHYHMDLLKLALIPAAIINTEGSLIYINGLAEAIFTSCSDLEPNHAIWDILTPDLREPLQKFLNSNELNNRIENADYITSFDRILSTNGSSLGVALRCSPYLTNDDH